MEYKAPDEVLQFTIDWTNQLGGSTIDTSTYSVESGITNDSDTKTSTTTTITISGGTAGETYEIENQITTAASETLEQHFYVRVQERIN